MSESSTLLALTQLVDISLNCHEGVINFQALHTLLHIIIQKIPLTDVAVEFRGPDSDRIQAFINTAKPAPQLLPEWSVVEETSPSTAKVTKGGKKAPKPAKKISLQDIVKHTKAEVNKEKEIRVIERRKDSKEDPDMNPLPLKSPQGSIGGITPGDLQTVVVVESQSQLPQFSVAISKSVFDDLQNEVQSMKTQIKELTELPGNLGLLESSRSRDSSTPILDMFQILNLTKRMDATETAMEKVGSLIEDIVKDDTILSKVKEVKDAVDPNSDSRRRSSIVGLDTRIIELEKAVEDISNQIKNRVSITIHEEDKPSVHEPSITGPEKISVGAASQEDAPLVTEDNRKNTIKSDSVKVFMPQEPFNSVVINVDVNDMPPTDALMLMQEEFQNLKKWITESMQEVDKKVLFGGGGGGGGDVDTAALDSKFEECAKKIEELNALYGTQIGLLSDQFNNVQNEMSDVVDKLEVLLPGGDSTGISAETTMDLANKLAILEKEMLAIHEHAEKLQIEKEERDKLTDTILEQIDVLKIVKANREDLEDALGDKADACMINRKVSHDQFDAACDDLSRGIEEALGKLEEQEEMWHQALDAIQKEVGNKLDKMEVDPLREFVNSKLRALQEKFKSLTQLRKEQEAAGTKSKFLRNVNCISCDKDVVMRKEMDVSLKPKAYAMPPSRNMAPYLAYELDQLRKQQKCVPGSKNLNFIESALKTRGARDKDHVCNRYCGGSHTVTTPQQRVTRLGHFLEQWGPEIAPLNDEYIRGNDKHMYKARDESLYNKGGKQDSNAKGTSRTSREAPTTDSGMPPPDRDTYISPDAQEAITTDEGAKASQAKKPHNIGSTGVLKEGSPRGSAQETRFSLGQQQPRTSQQRASSSASGEARTQRPSSSAAGEARPSQGHCGKL